MCVGEAHPSGFGLAANSAVVAAYNFVISTADFALVHFCDLACIVNVGGADVDVCCATH